MATSKSQRVGIWVIALTLIIGTVLGFVAMILSPQNQVKDDARLRALLTQYQKAEADYQKKVTAQSEALSKKYYDEFSQYKSYVSAFDAKTIAKLTTKDLKAGTGATVAKDAKYSAYYIGWNPKGKVFDQSLDKTSLKAPIASGQFIEGWNKGVLGMKIGGIRELSIPSAQAYGAMGSGSDIPPNTPIRFIVMIIPTVEHITPPQMPEELLKAYGQQ